MQAVSDLAKLRDAVIARCRTLQLLAKTTSHPLGGQDRRNLAFVIVEIDNLIVGGLRQLTKSCLLGCRTVGGQRVLSTSSATSSEEAAAHIYRALRPQGYLNRHSPPTIVERDELTFRDPKDAEKVLRFYSASNLANIQLALGLNAEVFGETKVFRHYFSHRARNTYEEVVAFAQNVGASRPRMPEELVIMGRPGTGVVFVEGWTADLINFFDLAC